MSYSTIKALWPGEKAEDLQKLSNSWGTAPLVWNALSEKYLHKKWIIDSGKGLWELWKDTRIPKHQRVLLMFTFDRAYVLKKDYPRMSQDIWAFLRDFPVRTEYENHWPTIARLFENNPEIPAIGIYCTSVSSDPFEGEWNDDKEIREPFDWNTAYDLYAELDALDG